MRRPRSYISERGLAPRIMSLATALVGQGILVASGVIVARSLGPENRGLLALLVITAGLVTQLGSLGVPLATTYWIAGERMPARSLLRRLSLFRTNQTAVAILVQLGLIWLLVRPHSPAHYVAVSLTSLAVVAAGLSQLYGLAVVQGLQRFAAFNLLRTLNPALYVAAVVALAAAGEASLIPITLALGVTSALSAATTWAVCRRVMPAEERAGHLRLRDLLSFGLRALIGSSPPLETFRLDQLIVGVALAPIALGYYVVAIAFTNLTRFIGQSLGLVTYPQVAAAADSEARLRILRRDVALGVVVCGATTVVLWLALPRLLPLFFGSQFAPAVSASRILLLSALFGAIRRVLSDGTRGAGLPSWGTAAEIVTVVLAVPAVLAVTTVDSSLETVAIVLVAANLIGLAVIAPALIRLPQPGEQLGFVARAASLEPATVLVAGLAVGVSILFGAIIAKTATADLRRAVLVSLAFCAAALLAAGLARFGPRAIGTLLLYGAGATFAFIDVRLTAWMTVSDLLLALAGLVLLTELPSLHLQSRTERLLLLAIGLIATGGLISSITSGAGTVALANLTRLIVASALTFFTFLLWRPARLELARLLGAMTISALITGVWALLHATQDYGRPAGLSQHPNHLALVCIIGLGPALVAAVRGGSRRLRLSAGIATVLIFGAIVVSGSRAGVIGAAAAAGLAAVLLRGRGELFRLARLGAVVVAIALVVVVGFTPQNAIHRLFGHQVQSVAQSDVGRREALSGTVDAIKSEPLTGVGFTDPLGGHDAFLQLWAAGGVLALGGGVLLVVTILSMLGRRSGALSSEHLAPELIAGAISLAGLLVALLLQNALWNRYIWITLAASAVAVAATHPRVRSTGSAAGAT